jgi:hypothetical protein
MMLDVQLSHATCDMCWQHARKVRGRKGGTARPNEGHDSPDESHEQPDVCFSEVVAREVPLLTENALHPVQAVEQLMEGALVRRLPGRKSAPARPTVL